MKKIGSWEIALFNPGSFDRIIPRRFHLERAEIDPKLLEDYKKETSDSLLKPVGVIISDKSNFSSEDNYLGVDFAEKPKNINIDELSKVQAEEGIAQTTFSEMAPRPQQPLIDLDQITSKEGASLSDLVAREAGNKGSYSQLDDLIKREDTLSSKTAPILLPTDLLFEYDSDHLRGDAAESLSKLAALIQRNPQAKFLIEGFTDSFGSDAYNLALSARRAQVVKEWLMNHQLIHPEQIESLGLGKTRFLVPSTGTIEQQRLNRRVEIVIQEKK